MYFLVHLSHFINRRGLKGGAKVFKIFPYPTHAKEKNECMIMMSSSPLPNKWNDMAPGSGVTDPKIEPRFPCSENVVNLKKSSFVLLYIFEKN